MLAVAIGLAVWVGISARKAQKASKAEKEHLLRIYILNCRADELVKTERVVAKAAQVLRGAGKKSFSKGLLEDIRREVSVNLDLQRFLFHHFMKSRLGPFENM